MEIIRENKTFDLQLTAASDLTHPARWAATDENRPRSEEFQTRPTLLPRKEGLGSGNLAHLSQQQAAIEVPLQHPIPAPVRWRANTPKV
jgi:hypothetical protein